MNENTLYLKILEALSAEGFEDISENFNEPQFMVPAEGLDRVVEKLLDFGLHHLSTITAYEQGGEINILYHFWYFGGLTLRVTVKVDAPCVPSLTPQIPGAEFYEREVREMLGVEFEGLINTSPLLLPENWQSPPPLNESLNVNENRLSQKEDGKEVANG